MRINIENCARVGNRSEKAWCLDELVRNLKELRDRTDAGDMAALDEFFGVFVFDDDAKRQARIAAKGGDHA